MKYIYIALYWIFGVLFGLVGIAFLFDDPSVSIPMFLLSLLLLPPVRTFVHKKTNKSLSGKTRALLIILLLIVFATLGGISQHKTDKKRAAEEERRTIEYYYAHQDSILTEINNLGDSEQFNNAQTIIRKYSITNDSKLKETDDRIASLLIKSKNTKREKDILTELVSVPAAQAKRNLDLYKELVSLDPTNTKYKEMVDYYTIKYDQQKIIDEEEQRKARIAAARKEKIESQFSAWNGAHRNLERVIKESMNDPDSFKHVETVYRDKGDHLIVSTTFRGKNAFGGIVKNTVVAKVSLDGVVLEIISQY